MNLAGFGSSNKKDTGGVSDNAGIKVVKTVTINRPASELYQFWRRLENLPRFMAHLESVTLRAGNVSHWVAKAPAGQTVEWDAEIINEKENELIAWSSLPGSGIPNAGSIRFAPAPGGRGTEVTVRLEYTPPGGSMLGRMAAKFLGEEPQTQVGDDLLRFKAFMETGEIPTIEGQPTGPSR